MAKDRKEKKNERTNNLLDEIFQKLEQALSSQMQICVEHHLEDGKYREFLVRELLTKILPSKYDVTNGFIIDSDGRKSKEMDIIIYDKSYVPPFFEETYAVLPIESVLCVIQVKTTLRHDSLKDAIKNLGSIDELDSKTGGRIISAKGCEELREERNIAPFRIIIAHQVKSLRQERITDIMQSHWLDAVYVVSESKLWTKKRNVAGVVNKDKNKLCELRVDGDVVSYDNECLRSFVMFLLDSLKLINNAIIINYEEYKD